MQNAARAPRIHFAGFVFLLCALIVPSRAQSPAAKSSPTVAPASPAVAPSAASPRGRITSYTLTPEQLRKAHDLYHIRVTTRFFSLFYGIFALWLILQLGWSAKFRDWAERVTGKRFFQVLIYTPLFVITLALLELPLDLFSETLSKRYGISVQTWRSWFSDWAKGELITIIIGSILVWILYTVIRRSPVRWWFYFWLISLPILLFITFVSPYVIDPLFNKYEPLVTKAPLLVPKLQQVSRRAGDEVPPERMFWMKASDKTIGTNASVNGFGASKRIIIWDTTIAQETTDEVLTDFGHEMGHYVLGHVWKGFLFVTALLFVLLFLGQLTIDLLLTKYGAFWRVLYLDDLASLPALLLLVSIFGVFGQAIGNSYSRSQENQADLYSLEVTHGIVPDPGQACAGSFQKYGETVFVEPDPNPLDVLIFYDHPPVADRIHLCVTYDPWSHGNPPQFIKQP
jgi:Zn-dependent protease with chaperone function